MFEQNTPSDRRLKTKLLIVNIYKENSWSKAAHLHFKCVLHQNGSEMWSRGGYKQPSQPKI